MIHNTVKYNCDTGLALTLPFLIERETQKSFMAFTEAPKVRKERVVVTQHQKRERRKSFLRSF